jgi:hypothetical protein
LGNKECFDDYLESYQKGIKSQIGGFLIKRNVFDQVGLFSEELTVAEDTDLFLRIAYRWPQFGYLVQPQTIYYNYRPRGITQQYKQSTSRLSLVDRQIKISAEMGKLDAFKPIATKKIKGWLRGAIKDSRIYEVKPVLTKYKDLLPLSVKCKMHLYALFPQITLMWFKLKEKLRF